MSDGMETVNLIEKVLDYECSVDDAITIETMMFKNMRTEIERLTAELEEYKRIAAEKTIERARLSDELAGARIEINRRDELCKKCEREYEAELDRYKQDVEEE